MTPMISGDVEVMVLEKVYLTRDSRRLGCQVLRHQVAVSQDPLEPTTVRVQMRHNVDAGKLLFSSLHHAPM
jgi:hypothetical protein